MSKWKTYGLLVALTVLTRLDTYALSDIEFDESVYFLMARSMTQGHAPYTAIWDHKPPGIYGVYFLAITLLGQSALAVRVFATLAIALSGWLAIQLHRRLRPDASYAWVPGVMVVLMFRKYGGEGANNELFFVPAAAGSILMLVTAVQNQGTRRPLQLLASGALAGVAFWIKFNVVLEIQVAGALAVWLLADRTLRTRWRRMGEEVVYAAVGFLIVAALVITPFALTDLLGLFRFSTIEANVRHVGNRMSALESLSFLLKVLEESMAQWALVIAGVVYHLRNRRDARASQYGFVVAWLLGALASALAPGQPYNHYALEMAVPLCLGAWLTFEDLFLAQLQGRAALAALSFLILASTGTSLVAVPLNVGRELVSLLKRRSLESIDTSRWVSNYIREHTRGDKVTLYVMDGQPLLYHLLEVDPPTRYAFPPFLLDPHFEHVTGSEAKPEVARILAGKPEWIVRRVDPFKESLMMREHIATLIANDYTLETTIHNLDVLHRVAQ
jgi:hypothetical protein